MQWRLVVKAQDGEKWELPIDSFSFTEELNKDRKGTFTFKDTLIREVSEKTGDSPEFILYGAYREVYLYDVDLGVLAPPLYSGYVAEPTLSRDAGGSKTRTVTTEGFLSLLAKRLTNESPTLKRYYPSQSPHLIIQDLITYTQGLSYGNIGITLGAGTTTTSHERTYKFDTIKQAIEKLTNNEIANGVDVDIDHQKAINVYSSKGSSRPDIHLFDYEDGRCNIQNYQIRINFIKTMANQANVLGQGQDEAMVTTKVDADNAFKSAFFLLQDRVNEKDTGLTTNLDAKGNAYVDYYKSPKRNVVLQCWYDDPKFTDYNIGDTLKVSIPNESLSDVMIRLRQRTLNDRGEVTLTFFAV